jgi:hypothetical protein
MRFVAGLEAFAALIGRTRAVLQAEILGRPLVIATFACATESTFTTRASAAATPTAAAT